MVNKFYLNLMRRNFQVGFLLMIGVSIFLTPESSFQFTFKYIIGLFLGVVGIICWEFQDKIWEFLNEHSN